MFEKFSRPYEERLVKELAVEEIFTAIHICGDTTRIVDSLAGYDFCVENGVSVQILTEFTSVLSLQHATEPAYRKRSTEHLLQFCQRSGGSGSYAMRLSMA